MIAHRNHQKRRDHPRATSKGIGATLGLCVSLELHDLTHPPARPISDARISFRTHTHMRQSEVSHGRPTRQPHSRLTLIHHAIRWPHQSSIECLNSPTCAQPTGRHAHAYARAPASVSISHASHGHRSYSALQMSHQSSTSSGHTQLATLRRHRLHRGGGAASRKDSHGDEQSASKQPLASSSTEACLSKKGLPPVLRWLPPGLPLGIAQVGARAPVGRCAPARQHMGFAAVRE